MLERATACFNAGARESLRCARKHPRSKRMLHSSFWNHGAGDLDLAPFAVSGLPMPHSLPHEPNDTSVRRLHEASTISTGTEGIFLDFLYPPQALALLHRANGQSWERWEVRNARRLPDGFIQASRGRSSRSFTHSAAPAGDINRSSALREEAGLEDTNAQNEGLVGLELDENLSRQISSKTPDDSDAWDWEASASNGQSLPDANVDVTGSVNDSLSSEGFADSPADLVTFTPGNLLEPGDGMLRADPMRSLRRLMFRQENASDPASSSNAWSLYMALDGDEKSEPRLMAELLQWLARGKSPITDAHCISLFWSTPSDARTLETYQAALGAFLRSDHLDSALALHKEALDKPSIGTQISKTLFRHAVENGMWDLALQTRDDHHAVSDEARRRLFWLDVSEIPNLIERVHDLPKSIKDERTWASKQNSYRELRLQLSREIISGYLPLGPISVLSKGAWMDRTTRVKIRKTFNIIIEGESNPASFLQQWILRILQWCESDDSSAVTAYARVHHVVSYLYLRYRDIPGISPPEEMLRQWVHLLTRYAPHVQTLRRTKHSVDLETLVGDYREYHGKVDLSTTRLLISFYAHMGDVGKLEEFESYLESEYPSYQDQTETAWASIQVHCNLGDLEASRNAFAAARAKAQRHNDEADLKCWNVMMNAYARVDDLDGAFTHFRHLLQTDGLEPDAYSFHPIAQMLARRGDVASVEDFLQQFDSISEAKRTTHLLGSHLLALVNDDDMEHASSLLATALPQVEAGEILGSLTGCFNIILVAHALRRDINAVGRVYTWMKRKTVPMNRDTYGALIQALVGYGRTGVAYRILKENMLKQGLRPTAFHFSLVMAGFLKVNDFRTAIALYQTMEAENIRHSVSSRRLRLRAKAMEAKSRGVVPPSETTAVEPVEEVVAELVEMMQQGDESALARKQPRLGLDSDEPANSPAAHFEFIISMYGAQKAATAAKELFNVYGAERAKRGAPDHGLPMRVLQLMMSCFWSAQRHDEIESYWKLAKTQADKIAPLVPVPDFRSLKPAHKEVPLLTGQGTGDGDLLSSTDAQERAELGFPVSDPLATTTATPATAQPAQTDTLSTPSLAPTRRQILSPCLRYYMLSLARQHRLADVITTVSQLLTQGYTLDMATWNTFIALLCDASPPLVLLAFVLTERHLIPQFPGWTHPELVSAHSRRARREGLQYMRARFPGPHRVLPHYRTLVRLAAALLQLRDREARGDGATTRAPPRKPRKTGRHGLDAWVGNVRLVRERAPRTVFAVQSMPMVDEPLQNKYLRRSS